MLSSIQSIMSNFRPEDALDIAIVSGALRSCRVISARAP